MGFMRKQKGRTRRKAGAPQRVFHPAAGLPHFALTLYMGDVIIFIMENKIFRPRPEDKKEDMGCDCMTVNCPVPGDIKTLS